MRRLFKGAGDSTAPGAPKSLECFRALSHDILAHANRGLPVAEFLRAVLRLVATFCDVDGATLRILHTGKTWSCEGSRSERGEYRLETSVCPLESEDQPVNGGGHGPALTTLGRAVMTGTLEAGSPFLTREGSFWTGNADKAVTLTWRDRSRGAQTIRIGGPYKSLALIPLDLGAAPFGVLWLKREESHSFSEEYIEQCEAVGESVAVGLLSHEAQGALRERVKEITCLYGVTRLTVDPGRSIEEVVPEIVGLLGPAWQHPEVARGRIVLDGQSYPAAPDGASVDVQRSEILVAGRVRGFVEMAYTEERPRLDEGPFLEEERSLLDAISRHLAMFIQRQQAEADRWRLQEQLRHADRLATIGQLAAGVAHELNEPLGNILGFAQLASRSAVLEDQARQDIQRIVDASLHARGIIRKLMLFARQVPPSRTDVDLNQVVTEGLVVLASRCEKEGIELRRELSSALPRIQADAGQLTQVLVNLVVNAIQAMPGGGRLTVGTAQEGSHLLLTVEDTGVGIDEKLRPQIFMPFFTTKDVHEGTGLGLSVVDGIVRSHAGSIELESQPGAGTRFVVRLPLGTPEPREG